MKMEPGKTRPVLQDIELHRLFAGKKASASLQVARQMLDVQKRRDPVSDLDETFQGHNIRKLEGLIRSFEEGKRIQNRDEQLAQERKDRLEQSVKEREAQKKQDIMDRLRSEFKGDDADWERLKDRVYDDYLLSSQKSEDDAAREVMQRGLRSVL